MQSDRSTITQATLKTSKAWAQAFRDYASIMGNMGNVDLIISGEKDIMRLPILWKNFMASAPAQALLANPPAQDNPWYDENPIIDIKPEPEPEPEPIIQTHQPEHKPEPKPEPAQNSKNALIEMIAQGLQEIAYKP